MSSIPEPVIAAIPVPLPTIDKIPIVYFDLETTGLGEYIPVRKRQISGVDTIKYHT